METRHARSLRKSNHALSFKCLTAIALTAFASLTATPAAFAQKVPSPQEAQDTAEQAQYRADLEQVKKDRAGYAAAIVARWQAAAQASGKWDSNYGPSTFGALMKLGNENLLAAGQATSYEGMLAVLALGSLAKSTTQPSSAPDVLGDANDDLVYTPINPCRIVDTRNIGSPILAGSVRNFDVDNPASFAFQGGIGGPCPGMPFAVATAVALNITATNTVGPGFFTAWSLCGIQPAAASTVNYAAGQTIANGVIVPDCPGAGDDIKIFAGTSTADLVIDLVGYFAAPVATPLNCTTVFSASTIIASGNNISLATPDCPAGFTVTGGGQRSTVFFPLVSDSGVSGNGWICQGNNTGPNPITVTCQARCCQIPGR